MQKAQGNRGDVTAQRLPVTRSVLSADALVPLLQEAYAFNVRSCRLIKAFVLHTYHVVTDDKQYIFRIYPHGRRTRIAILAELRLLNYLEANSVPVSIPVTSAADQLLLLLPAPEGKRWAALFTYAPGTPLTEISCAGNIRAYGRALGMVHRQFDKIPFTVERSPLDFNRLVAEPIKRLAATFPQRQRDWSYLREWAPRLEEAMQMLGREPPCFGICHGDAASANVHVTADGQLTLFDFDFCGPGWRAYDLGTFLIDTTDEVAEAFLAGYREIRAIDPKELSALPAFQAAQNVWLLGLRASYVNEWGTAFFSDRFVDSVLAAIRQNLAKLDR